MAQDSVISSKVWSIAHVLRDDGVSYGDYLEQLTFLLFLKMVDEFSQPYYDYNIELPENCGWQILKSKRGEELDSHYSRMLRELAKAKGLLGQIYVKSQNKIQDPAKLYRIIDMIDQIEWNLLSSDVKGDIYEGLLEKNSEDIKSGAGQYFTPRSIIRTMVKCIRPEPMKNICDPACGSGGFFLAAYDYIKNNYKLNQTQKEYLKNETFWGNEIVAGARRICLMNMFLHQIGDIDKDPRVLPTDSLIALPKNRADYVITNPPFGKKSSITVTNEDGKATKEEVIYNRQDFVVTTSNKQLNFLQHINSILKETGKAAVVLPDNVLFEGGAGETVRKQLLNTTDLHTILRLPTGVFYAQGVKANVLFFDNQPASPDPQTREVWFYDYRTNIHHTLKKSPMREEHLEDFIKCYNPENRYNREETWSEDNPDGRWRKYTYEQIIERDKTNLDIFWLKDDSLTDLENLPDPDVLANEIIEEMESALESFKEISDTLEE